MIPLADCYAIVREVDAASVCANPALANRLAMLLLGSFPAREVGDSKIFGRMITLVFEEFPADIGWEAVNNLTRGLKRFPTRADAHAECTALMRRREHAKRIAQAHMAKHGEIAAEQEAKQRQSAEWRASFAKFPHRWIHAKWGPLFEPRLSVNRWLVALENWVKQFGADEVEAWHQRVCDRADFPTINVLEELTRLAQEAERRQSPSESPPQASAAGVKE